MLTVPSTWARQRAELPTCPGCEGLGLVPDESDRAFAREGILMMGRCVCPDCNGHGVIGEPTA